MRMTTVNNSTTVMRLKGHRGRINCVAFADLIQTENNNVLYAITGSSDNEAIVWTLRGPFEFGNATFEVSRRLVHDCSVTVCAIYVKAERDRLVAATVCRDSGNIVRIWDVQSGMCERQVQSVYGRIRSLSFVTKAANEGLILVMETENHMEELDLNDDEDVNPEVLYEDEEPCKPRLHWEPDSEEIVVETVSGTRTTVLTGQTRITWAKLWESGRFLFSSDVDGVIKMFDLSSAEMNHDGYIWQAAQVFDSHSGCINHFVLYKSLILTASDDCTSFLLDYRSEERHKLLAVASGLHPRLGSKAHTQLQMIFGSTERRHRVRIIIRDMLCG